MNEHLHKHAMRAIKQYYMINYGDTVIVACSGGADSMALLRFLHFNKRNLGITVHAAHVNHGLRGAESDADEQFVANFCKDNDITLHCKRLNLPLNASENMCREKRYEFFYSLEYKYENCKVATAHTKNDNAETVLLHIARGSGLVGICGIAPVADRIIRPFLFVSRVEVEDYLKANNTAFITDSTNLTDKFARNRVRLNILPQLERINPEVYDSFERLALISTQTVEYMQLSAHELLQKAYITNVAGEGGYNCRVLANAHVAVRNAALHMLFAPMCNVNQKRINLANDAILNGSGSVEINKQYTFCVKQKIARIVRNKYLINNISDTNEIAEEISINDAISHKTINLLGGYTLLIKLKKYEKKVNFEKTLKKHLKNVADYDKIVCDAVFRVKKMGDIYCVPTSGMTKPLKKVYSEAKLSSELRAINPVLAMGNTIVWANSFGTAKNYLPDENTRNFLIIDLPPTW